VAVRGLLFDFDGLILDTESPSLAAWQAVYDDHGHELTIDRWSAAIGTINGFDPFAHLEELVGAPVDRAAITARRRKHELSLIEAEELRPGIAEYLAEAERLGLRKAIVSSGSRDWIDAHLRRLEQLVGWDAIVTADGDEARAKPDPILYVEALERLRLDVTEAVAFEDSPNGIRAAKAAGIYCVAVPNAATAPLAFDQADLKLESLSELPLSDLLAKVDSRT
jgi:HAD superfamily hydrolase (TIGR01509 family)